MRLNLREVGFLSARLISELDGPGGWGLRVVSPDDVEELRTALQQSAIMSVTLMLRSGDAGRGQASVSSISESAEAAALVLLARVDPLALD